MAPRPYSDKSSLPNDSSNDPVSEIPTQVLPETPSPSSFSGTSTPSPTPQEQIPVEPMMDSTIIHENNRTIDLSLVTPCYPTPGDIMPYDHSLPDFIRQITNQPNLANLHSLSLRVISTLISLHRMSSYLPNLRELDLEGSILNSLRDIGCNLKNLQILKVGRCQLESLDGTFGLSSLRELYAQKNFINDVSPCSNLPHIRHIDVSGNRIRNISYAGFLSVCSKLRSVIFTGNPATEVPGYRKHVRRILPQLETLDGVSFINEDNTEEPMEPESGENYCEGSDSSSVEVPDFTSVSPSDSMNNFFESEEDAYYLEKKNKQAKNLANQDQFDGADYEVSQVKTNFQDEFQNLSLHQTKVKKELLEQAKILENRNANIKQKCVSIQKLDKDIENRSKQSNVSLNANFTGEFDLPEKNSALEEEPSTSAISELQFKKAEKVERPSTTTVHVLDDAKMEEFQFGDIKERLSLGFLHSQSKYKSDEEQIKDGTPGPCQLTTGLPICGNLTAALRNRKKNQNTRDEKVSLPQKPSGQSEREKESQTLEDHINGSGDYLNSDLREVNEEGFIGEDVLVASKKWREAFRRFRSNNRARWEEEDESDYTNLLGETSKGSLRK